MISALFVWCMVRFHGSRQPSQTETSINPVQTHRLCHPSIHAHIDTRIGSHMWHGSQQAHIQLSPPCMCICMYGLFYSKAIPSARLRRSTQQQHHHHRPLLARGGRANPPFEYHTHKIQHVLVSFYSNLLSVVGDETCVQVVWKVSSFKPAVSNLVRTYIPASPSQSSQPKLTGTFTADYKRYI